MSSAFARFVGIDYSGAETPYSGLTGLRIFVTDGTAPPTEVRPPSARHWTRAGIAEWLVQRLAEEGPTLVGMDHGFSFPAAYFEAHGLAADWPAFLDDFQHHWPTDQKYTYVDFVRDGLDGNAAARSGNSRWRRLTELRAGRAKSVFHFDFPGSVAKSTHAGLPWLRFIRQRLAGRVHFWPFDGWELPEGRSVVAEVYPALWTGDFATEDRTTDQHDAYVVAAWLSRADADGSLADFLSPDLTSAERLLAQIEGWILGVPGPPKLVPTGKARAKRKTRSGPREAIGSPTTKPGYRNRNGQTVLAVTGMRGNDHNQVVYLLRCEKCRFKYGANGSDIWQRRCPQCQDGAPDLS